MPHRRPYCVVTIRGSGWAFCSGLLVLLLALVVQPCLSAAVLPHPNCTEPCGEDLLCASADCKTEWDSCPAGTVQSGNMTMVTDESGACHDTECSPGGCEKGYSQVGSGTPCFSIAHCAAHLGACNIEHCCPLRPSFKCCQQLPCNTTYKGCEVPRQAYLSDASRSEIEWTRIRHGDSAPFPFYTDATLVTPGGSCDAVRVYGRCLCDDGRKVPGCEPTNSSTWYLRLDGPQTNASAAAATTPLPANLSLTCTVAPPPPPTTTPSPLADATASATAEAAANATADATANATATAEATAQGLRSPPPAPPPGGSGGRQGSDSPQQQQQRGGNGTLVALIVIGCLALAGCTTGIVLWCCGLMPDLHNLRIRNLTTYEPILTGQSYTPGRSDHRRHPPSRSSGGGGGGGGDSDDVPWSRFCAAVTEASRRVLYGRRYLEESASTAAAAERYRTLNSLGRRRSDAAAGEDAGPAWGMPGKPTRGSLVLSTYPSARPKPHDDDLGVDEVFTLEDLGAGSNDTAGAWRRPVGQLPVSRSAIAAAGSQQLPQSLRASSGAPVASPSGPWHLPAGGAAVAAPTPAELFSDERASRGPSAASAAAPTGQLRPRLNQFGRSSDPDGGGGGGHDVIHTRPLALGGGDGGDEFEVPPDVDAPLRWLPSPQVTGQGPT